MGRVVPSAAVAVWLVVRCFRVRLVCVCAATCVVRCRCSLAPLASAAAPPPRCHLRRSLPARRTPHCHAAHRMSVWRSAAVATGAALRSHCMQTNRSAHRDDAIGALHSDGSGHSGALCRGSRTISPPGWRCRTANLWRARDHRHACAANTAAGFVVSSAHFDWLTVVSRIALCASAAAHSTRPLRPAALILQPSPSFPCWSLPLRTPLLF